MSKTIVTNRKALRDYEVLESLEAGIELKGSEVKSLRDAKVNLNDSFARFEKGELFLYNAHISHYSEASYLNVDPVRTRKLLLHKGQIQKLSDKLTQKGLTLIPLKAYFNDRGYAKFEIALCKGKKLYDKRDDIKRRESNLEIRRALKHKNR
ncbi:MAG: SsrA-binding protein SmpB [Candidatus Omnitrophica bacterium]|jgi:SsrA-binding protein|nr:SsrA-binding protein SmpB [Candidatus Omnitrophota bacterium]